MERSGNFYKAIQLGYILISILIGCMAYNSLYEWQEIEALELGNKKIEELRKEINNINIQMIKFSLLGETILEWNDKDIEHYHARRMAMDSMLCRFKGYFHEAEGGTLFLDEVGNLALETQQMLLRAIQERRYRPVGDKADRNFNVRIIAATNEDLEVSVNEKRFRQDLLYRLHDFGITVPPLRDCQEDIMPLAEFFRDMANRELECSVSGFSSEARKALLTHAWPGNVRELRQKVMGAVLQAQEGVVMKEHLELAVTKPTSTVNFALRNDAEDKERILRALKQANGNRSVAAELLGIGRTTLYSKLEEYGLKYKFKQS